MQNNWVDEQHKVLAEMAVKADALKDRATPKRTEPIIAAVPPTSSIERFRSRRKWILIILLWVNSASLFHIVREEFARTDSVELWFEADYVAVYQDTAGNPSYRVEVPVNEFPYDHQLKQGARLEPLGFAIVNLLLLAGLVHAFWRESQLVADDMATNDHGIKKQDGKIDEQG